MQIWFLSVAFQMSHFYSPFFLFLYQPTQAFNEVCYYIYTKPMKRDWFIIWLPTDRPLKFVLEKILNLNINFQSPYHIADFYEACQHNFLWIIWAGLQMHTE